MAWVSLLASVMFLILGMMVQMRSTERALKPPFFWLCISTALWQGCWSGLFLLPDGWWVIPLIKVGYSFILFLPTAMYYFLVSLTRQGRELKGVGASFAVSLCLLFLLWATPWVIDGYYHYYFGFYPKAGELLWIHILQTMILAFRSAWLINRARMSGSGGFKHQLNYAGLGLGLYGLAALDYTCNYGIEWFPPGVICLLGYILILGIAISKHELMSIPVVISRTLAFALSLGMFGLLYVGWIWPYYYWVSTVWDMGYFALTMIYFAVLGVKFQPILRLIQTTTYKKFLHLTFQFETTLTMASQELVNATTPELVWQCIMNLQDNLDIENGVAFIRSGAHFDLKSMGGERGKERFSMNQFGLDHPFIISLPKESVVLASHIPAFFSAYPTHTAKMGLIMTIRAFNEPYGVFMFGNKLSEESYSKKEIALLQVISNQATMVIERLIQTAQIEALNSQLETHNQELSVKVKQAIALAQQHFHQAAMASLSAGIAHEIRNPMAAMMGSAEHLAITLGGKVRVHDTPVRIRSIHPSAPPEWHCVMTPAEFYPFCQGDKELAYLIYEYLRSKKILDDNGYLMPSFVSTISSILPPDPLNGSAVVWDSVVSWIQDRHRLFKFINIMGVQIPRILDITDSMMKYGVSGGGVHRHSFAKIDGFTTQLSSQLYDELVECGGLDQNGCVLPPLQQGREEVIGFLNRGLSEKLTLRASDIMEVIANTPGAVKKPINVSRLIESIVGMIKGDCQKKGIAVNVQDAFSGRAVVLGDDHRLQQAFFNIMYNAKQAMEKVPPPLEGHSLTIRLHAYSFVSISGENQDGIRVSFCDTGSGITSDTKQKIFDPFFTTKSGEASRNIGLGLSILQEVILNHDGVIDVDSTVGEGTTFHVMLKQWLGDDH